MLRTLQGRQGRSYGIGALLCSVALIVPLVFGVAPVPRELPFSENVAWLANEAQGDVVRLNIDTGRIDARLGLDSVAESMAVSQNYGSVIVKASDRLTAIDLASLAWGSPVSAQGDLFVGDDVAYLVARDGTVDALDPETLESKGEVDLGATVARPVVDGERLIVPVSDGTVAVLEKSEIIDRLEVGSDSDRLEVTMVDDDAVALNLTDGSLLRFDPTHSKISPDGDVDFDPPSGPVLVPDASPGDQVWMAAPADGELVGVDIEDGSTASVEVTEPGHDLVGPVVVGDRVYVVDVSQSVVIGVDMDGPEVVDLQQIDIEDPGSVEMLVVGKSVVVNDKSGPSAVVIDDRGEFMQVDKYSEDGVATPLDDVELVSDTGGNDDATDPSEPGDAPPPQGNPPPEENPGEPPRDQGQPSPQPGPSPQPPPPPPPPSTTTSTTDPGVDPPGAVGGLSATSDDGRSTLSWSAPGGDVDDYVIEVSPPINGRTSYTSTGTSYPFTSLANGTQYTFTVSARNEGGTSPGSSATATPGGHPTVSGVSPGRTGDREFSVSFSYDNNGRAVDTCQVTVNGTSHNADCNGGTGSVGGISVGDYATDYTFTATVTTSLGSQDASGSASSAGKPLTVDADPYRWANDAWGGGGVCTWNPDEGGQPNTRPYFNAANLTCPDENPGPAGYLPDGTAVRATCRTEGDEIRDDVPDPNGSYSSTWLRVDGYGYMNTLYFSNWDNNPESNLPTCG